MPRTGGAGGGYLARLNFTDGMGELWEWVTALPEGSRVQEIFFHLQLGIKVASSLKHASEAAMSGGQPPAPAAAVAVPDAPPAPSSQSLVLDDDWDPVGLLGAETS